MNFYTKRSSLIELKGELKQIDSNYNFNQIGKLMSTLNSFNSFEDDNEYLKFQVFSIISYYSGYEVKEINDNQNLKFDLSIKKSEKILFIKKFNDLILELGGDKKIKKAELNEVESVGDCLKLIISKLN